MKATIKYLKTGKVEIIEISSVFYTKGKIGIVHVEGFSNFYPEDEVEIEIDKK